MDSISDRIDNLISRPQKLFEQPMSYDEARKLVWYACQAKSRIIGKEFVVDEYNRGIIQNLIRYFIGDPDCEWDHSKGVFLYGQVGTGKTYLMSVLQTFVDASGIDFRRFEFHTCADIADGVEIEGVESLRKYFNSETDICFDDFGQEAATIKRYGNELNAMERILTKRYNAFIAGKCITHLTSNMDLSEVENVYGTRLADRFREMFNIVFFPGGSRRK